MENYNYYNFPSGDVETFDEMDRENMMVYVIVIVVVNLLDMFNANELEKGRSQSMDSNVCVGGCVGHNAHHTKLVQNSYQFHIGGA
jgi:hypothetical protein